MRKMFPVQSQFVRSVKEEEVPTVQNAPVPALMFRAGTDMVLPSAYIDPDDRYRVYVVHAIEFCITYMLQYSATRKLA